jgi:hypothetical protein
LIRLFRPRVAQKWLPDQVRPADVAGDNNQGERHEARDSGIAGSGTDGGADGSARHCGRIAGTEGLRIYVTSTSPVIATCHGSLGAFIDSLYLDVGGDFDAANDGSPPCVPGTSTAGQTVNLGSFAVGTELFFRLNVRNQFETPNVIWNYFTGPGSRNADGKARARVHSEWLPGTTLVSRKTSLISISGISAFRSPARPRSSHSPASPSPARSRCLASASQGRA